MTKRVGIAEIGRESLPWPRCACRVAEAMRAASAVPPADTPRGRGRPVAGETSTVRASGAELPCGSEFGPTGTTVLNDDSDSSLSCLSEEGTDGAVPGFVRLRAHYPRCGADLRFGFVEHALAEEEPPASPAPGLFPSVMIAFEPADPIARLHRACVDGGGDHNSRRAHHVSVAAPSSESACNALRPPGECHNSFQAAERESSLVTPPRRTGSPAPTPPRFPLFSS
jgi:hypothetical protein